MHHYPFLFPTFSGMYWFYGLPNLSHVTNAGDQYVNLSLRASIRRATKLRMLEFVLNRERGLVPADARLPHSQSVMKRLLPLWVSEWLTHGSIARVIRTSWENVLTRDLKDIHICQDEEEDLHVPGTSSSAPEQTIVQTLEHESEPEEEMTQVEWSLDVDAALARKLALGLRE